jgi:hypothetical protein
VLEVRRAWSPESVRVPDRGALAPGETGELSHLMPALVEEVTKLRREIAAVRAAELEVALRNRQRELLLTQAARAAAEPPTPTPTPTPTPGADAAPEPQASDDEISAEPAPDAVTDDAVTDDAVADDDPRELTLGDIASLWVPSSGDRR